MDEVRNQVSEHFCYVCKKGENADKFMKIHFDSVLDELEKNDNDLLVGTLSNKPKVKVEPKEIEPESIDQDHNK